MLPSKKKKNDKKFEFYAKFKSKGDKKKGGSGVQRLECWRMVRTRAGSNFFQNLVGAFSSILVDFLQISENPSKKTPAIKNIFVQVCPQQIRQLQFYLRKRRPMFI